jgi:signal transduction histidine kinase
MIEESSAVAHRQPPAGVSAAQARLHGLIQAQRLIVGDLDLPTLLHRIVQTSVDLVDARYGALGIVGSDGRRLEQFIHVGMTEEQVRATGALPEGKGLLGVLIDEPYTIRIRELATHPRSTGFPPGHPQMHGFLGVPIRVRGETFGNLYLTRDDDRGFTVEDEQLVQALAATAAVAIENARLFATAEHHQDWLAASAEISQRVLTGSDASLRLVAQEVRRLADADLITVVLPHGAELRVAVAEGGGAPALEGRHYPRAGSLSDRVIRDVTPVRLTQTDNPEASGGRLYLADWMPIGPTMVLPLLGSQEATGTLVVARRRDAHPFTTSEMEMATAFANHASVALEMAEARRDQELVRVLEDRARIARDLHDHVIQQLFAAGLSVQAVVAHVTDARTAASLEGVVGTLDAAIKRIRLSIFESGPRRAGTLRAAVLDVVDELRPALGFEPGIDLDGPLDALISDDLSDDVIAFVRESLTNVAKHARARRAMLTVHATSAVVSVTVSDDGDGIGRATRRSGLYNLQHRAAMRQGSMVVDSDGVLGGTTVVWTVPIMSPATD